MPRRQHDHLDSIRAEWRRARPDLDVSALVLLGRLFRVARLADIVLAEGTARHGLHPGWFDLLAALRRAGRSEEHTSELQSRENLVCRLLLEKKKKKKKNHKTTKKKKIIK